MERRQVVRLRRDLASNSVEGEWAAALRTVYGLVRQLAPLILAHRGADTIVFTPTGSGRTARQMPAFSCYY